MVRIVSIELDAVPVRQRGISPSRGAPVGVSDSDADNTSAEGVPSISGTTQVGQTLIASTSGITDADGLTNAQFSYQWVRNDGTTDHDIPGATGFSYTLTSSEVENTIKVLVTFADDSGNHDIVTSEATGAVPPLPNTEAHGYPAIHGSAVLGQTLTATTAGMEDANGLSNATFRFQWFNSYQASETDETVYYEVAWYHGGTERTYTLRNDDVSRKIMVQVSYVDDGGNPESLTSESTAAVVRPSGIGGSNTPAAGSLALSGTAKVGETLTADISGITDDNGLVGVSFSYTWSANDGLLLGQSVVPTYTIRPKDVGLSIDVTVHFTDDDGYHEQMASTATSAVLAATPAPPQNLKVSKEGKGSLDLKWDTPVVDMEGLRNGKGTKGDGGSPIRKYKVQWKESADSWDTPEEVSEDAVQNTTHTIGDLTGDTQYDVRVVATNDVGDGAASEQVSGTPQLGNAPAVGIPTISGTAHVGETLTANTSGISDSDGLTSVSYSYQWISSDGTSDADIVGATGSTYVPVAADEGKAIKLTVSFTDDAGNDETLTSAATGVVAPSPLTVALETNPSSHNGTDVFTFRVQFSEETNLSFRTLRVRLSRWLGEQSKRQNDRSRGATWGGQSTLSRILIPTWRSSCHPPPTVPPQVLSAHMMEGNCPTSWDSPFVVRTSNSAFSAMNFWANRKGITHGRPIGVAVPLAAVLHQARPLEATGLVGRCGLGPSKQRNARKETRPTSITCHAEPCPQPCGDCSTSEICPRTRWPVSAVVQPYLWSLCCPPVETVGDRLWRACAGVEGFGKRDCRAVRVPRL